MILDTKRCSMCGTEKPANAFYPRHDRASGLRSRCKECENKVHRQWCSEHPQSISVYNRQDRIKHRAKRIRYATQYRIEHQERLTAQRKINSIKRAANTRRWHKANPDKSRIQGHRYRARKRNLPVNFTDVDWQHCLSYFHGQCAVCYRYPGNGLTLAMDHWIPLADTDCPGAVPSNIVPLCHGLDGCNNSKHNKPPLQWLNERYEPDSAQDIATRIARYFDQIK